MDSNKSVARPVEWLETSSSEYPRPAFRRQEWANLNGQWQFAIDADARLATPDQVKWDGTIQVPFAPETPASGVNNQGLYCAVWYRLVIETPVLKSGNRLKLHFGAVDYAATVWINGVRAGEHQGGYTPFTVEIQNLLIAGEVQEIVVRAEDDPADLEKPRGKQDWKQEPHSIWYPRTTGIWQTVWLEVVPSTYISKARWTSNLTRWELGAEVHTVGSVPRGATLALTMRIGDQILAQDRYGFVTKASDAGTYSAGELHRTIALSDPGVDDFRNELLWSPSNPTLIDVDLKLLDADGTELDAVTSYTALRSIAVQGDLFVLNGRPLPLRFVLDQGYWPKSGLTAPDSEAFQRDILLVKELGFNGVRKHQKIEDPRFLYWADQFGLLVWEEMPSAYRYTRLSIERTIREWSAALDRDMNHPCIVSWVPLNESWGVPDLPDNPAQRHYVQALYYLTKTIDPSRPVIGNDGWESVATDLIGIHDYDANPESIGKRYGVEEIETRLFEHERPGGRILRLKDSQDEERQPIVLTEFGGIALRDGSDPTWGYSDARTPEEFQSRYVALLTVIRSLPALAGFCYTQFTDTYQEANGLVHADRSDKVSRDVVALATSGQPVQMQNATELRWRERLMQLRAKTR
ncbi:MAG: glycoside hydrolase family 2 protein [Janthinobacterium lividum]